MTKEDLYLKWNTKILLVDKTRSSTLKASIRMWTKWVLKRPEETPLPTTAYGKIRVSRKHIKNLLVLILLKKTILTKVYYSKQMTIFFSELRSWHAYSTDQPFVSQKRKNIRASTTLHCRKSYFGTFQISFHETETKLYMSNWTWTFIKPPQ